MVKVFTPNKNGKIEFSKKELEKLLNEVWRDGYNSNNNYYWYSPWYYSGTTTVPLSSTTIASGYVDSSTTTIKSDDNITYTGDNTIKINIGD